MRAIEKKTRILVVDDETSNVELMTEALEREGYHVASANTGEDGLHKLKAWSPQLVLLDINMPGMSGLKTLEQIRKMPDHDYIAVIFVSANLTTEDIVVGLDQGADDYLVKPFRIAELLARVRSKIRIKNLHDQLHRAMKRLEGMVDTDDLTGLFNMRSLYQKLDVELLRAKRYRKQISCIMMDVDNFKNVNDDNDHLFGSWVLTEIAKIIRSNTRAIDIAARYGGDEYLLILPETDLPGAERLAERIRKTIEATVFSQEKQRAELTASFGIASFDCTKKEIPSKEFVRAADQLLFEAKKAGRNCLKTKTLT
ncbi:MAG: diguanylate cyclase [Oligoflexia bacterium]|nr:diguanylate cyclase [Oligoflexia bacterium]